MLDQRTLAGVHDSTVELHPFQQGDPQVLFGGGSIPRPTKGTLSRARGCNVLVRRAGFCPAIVAPALRLLVFPQELLLAVQLMNLRHHLRHLSSHLVVRVRHGAALGSGKVVVGTRSFLSQLHML